MKVTKLPPGSALHADDLENWSRRRRGHQAKSESGIKGIGRKGHKLADPGILNRHQAFWKAKRRQWKFAAIDRKFGRIP